VFEQTLAPVFAALQVPFVVRNHALGNNPCYPYDACIATHLGEDLDILAWEQVLSVPPFVLWWGHYGYVSYAACVNRLCVQLESLQPDCNYVCFVYEEHELRTLVDAAGHLLSRVLSHAQEGRHLCSVNRRAMVLLRKRRTFSF
jgi:hypothetical protein